MVISAKISALREIKWHEYAVRFVLGGAATLVTGLIAQAWGPKTGGLFLAFPAIFAASATLIEKHQRERKERLGLQGKRRGKDAAALDAAGAALGSIGMAAFGAIVWLLAPSWSWLSLPAALVGWTAVSIGLWLIFPRFHARLR